MEFSDLYDKSEWHLERIADAVEWLCRILDPDERHKNPPMSKRDLAIQSLRDAEKELENLPDID